MDETEEDAAAKEEEYVEEEFIDDLFKDIWREIRPLFISSKHLIGSRFGRTTPLYEILDENDSPIKKER